jgi:hypothetical protein
MARVLGEAGHYVSEEADKKSREMFGAVFAAIGVLGWISGFLFWFLFQKKLWWVSLLINGIALAAALALRWWAYRRMDKLAKERKDLLRGATGEVAVGYKLANFPESFYVVNDLKTEAGNLDHVVIGPTGVFALDAKSWRGIVSADGKGELLLNGRFDKPYIRQFVGRIMGIRDRVKVLAPEMDVFIKAVFVFTSARVEANWGTTGNVHCIRDDQAYDYIVEDKKGKKLTTKEVKTIARAFAALARMDPHFSDKTLAKENPRPSSAEPPKPIAAQPS